MASRILILIPFLLAIPLAILLGFSASSPDSLMSLGILGLCIVALLVPLLLRRHELFLVFSWNAVINIPFLPGNLQLWMVMAVGSAIIAFFATGLNRGLQAPSGSRSSAAVTWMLVFLAGVVLLTAESRGGIGIRAGGGDTYGGHRYICIFFAIIGFFALKRIQIPKQSLWLYIWLFLGSTVLACMSNLIYYAGPSFYWLYSIFPVTFALNQAGAEQTGSEMTRFTGLAFAVVGPYCYMLARYGILGIFQWRRPLKLILFFLLIGLCALGGFRSQLIFLALIFFIQALFEGLCKPRFIFGALATGGLVVILLLGVSEKLPLSIQRTISFLPVKVDPLVRMQAEDSTQWRLRMWDALWHEVPDYLWVGKGYGYNPSEVSILNDPNFSRGEDFSRFIVTGDYHSGPFSVLLSFGIFGVIAVILFWGVSIRLLYLNYRGSSSELLGINTLLLTVFIAHVLFFLFIYGDLANDFYLFCGLVGFSIALNRHPPVVKTSENALLYHNA